MKPLNVTNAKITVLDCLTRRPHGRVELDSAIGWTNAPMAVRILRESGIHILTTRGEDRRGIYSLPADCKAAAYALLKRLRARLK